MFLSNHSFHSSLNVVEHFHFSVYTISHDRSQISHRFHLLNCLIPDKHNVCNHLLAVVIRFGDAPDTVTVTA